MQHIKMYVGIISLIEKWNLCLNIEENAVFTINKIYPLTRHLKDHISLKVV